MTFGPNALPVIARGAVHFWVSSTCGAEIDGWDPDQAPERYASGVGHGLVELFVRLRAREPGLTIGPRVPREASVVVAHANSLIRSTTDVVRFLAAARRQTIVLIRSDVPLRWSLPGGADVEVMPNRSACVKRNQIWLPLLPQRGLRARDPRRRGHVRTATIKANPENVPAQFRTPQWASALEALGLAWIPDVPQQTDGSDNRWNDFSDVDVSICYRDDSGGRGMLRKPATRLVNAWMAGCIPIVGREPAYLELVNDGRDGLVVNDVDECLDALRRLTVEPELVARLEAGGATRAQDFTVDCVLDQWQTLLRRVASDPDDRHMAPRRLATATAVGAGGVVRRVARAFR